MCTAFDLESLRHLNTRFDLSQFKVASGEILTLDMLEYMAGCARPIILSTGMATDNEIQSAINVLESKEPKKITLLYCVSNYPAPLDDVDLRVMTKLRDKFQYPVGFSDHTVGSVCTIAAVALGATVIEKHVTLNKDMKGPKNYTGARSAPGKSWWNLIGKH